LNYYIPIIVHSWHDVIVELDTSIQMKNSSYGFLPAYLTIEDLRADYHDEDFIVIDGPEIDRTVN
jgi:hypothetical protein